MTPPRDPTILPRLLLEEIPEPPANLRAAILQNISTLRAAESSSILHPREFTEYAATILAVLLLSTAVWFAGPYLVAALPQVDANLAVPTAIPVNQWFDALGGILPTSKSILLFLGALLVLGMLLPEVSITSLRRRHSS